MLFRITEREGATILAALRRWLSYPAAREADSLATKTGKYKPLDNGEIEVLCKRLIKIKKSAIKDACFNQPTARVRVIGSRQAELIQQIDNIECEGAKKRSGRPAHQHIRAWLPGRYRAI